MRRVTKDYAELLAQVIPVIALAVGVNFAFLRMRKTYIRPSKIVSALIDLGITALAALAAFESYALHMVAGLKFRWYPTWIQNTDFEDFQALLDVAILAAFVAPAILGSLSYRGAIREPQEQEQPAIVVRWFVAMELVLVVGGYLATRNALA